MPTSTKCRDYIFDYEISIFDVNFPIRFCNVFQKNQGPTGLTEILTGGKKEPSSKLSKDLYGTESIDINILYYAMNLKPQCFFGCNYF